MPLQCQRQLKGFVTKAFQSSVRAGVSSSSGGGGGRGGGGGGGQGAQAEAGGARGQACAVSVTQDAKEEEAAMPLLMLREQRMVMEQRMLMEQREMRAFLSARAAAKWRNK